MIHTKIKYTLKYKHTNSYMIVCGKEKVEYDSYMLVKLV